MFTLLSPVLKFTSCFKSFFLAKKTQKRRDDGMYTLCLYVQCSLIQRFLLYTRYSQSEVPIRYNTAVPEALFVEQFRIGGSCYVHLSVL